MSVFHESRKKWHLASRIFRLASGVALIIVGINQAASKPNFQEGLEASPTQLIRSKTLDAIELDALQKLRELDNTDRNSGEDTEATSPEAVVETPLKSTI